MSEPFLGEMRIFGFDYAPKGWAQCSGQTMSIQQNTALFSLLGTMYGGDGVTTFKLPDLRGRVPLHIGSGFVQGQASGSEGVTLLTTQIPVHTHQPAANATAGGNDQGAPTNNFWANSGESLYATSPTANTFMAAQAIGNAGGSLPHPNQSPYLTLNISIALTGIFPSRN